MKHIEALHVWKLALHAYYAFYVYFFTLSTMGPISKIYKHTVH